MGRAWVGKQRDSINLIRAQKRERKWFSSCRRCQWRQRSCFWVEESLGNDGDRGPLEPAKTLARLWTVFVLDKWTECRREISRQGEEVNKDLLNDFSRFVFSDWGDVGAGYFQNKLPATSQYEENSLKYGLKLPVCNQSGPGASWERHWWSSFQKLHL